jgi:hypothetical protein
LRERIEPAQDLTFFCFLLGFLDIEDLLEVHGSIDSISTSCATISGDDGAVSSFLDSFPEDALVGRDFGDDSPEPVGPKNDHFFADRGVDGVGLEAAATSESRGRDERLLGVGSSALDTSWSKIGSAVRGRPDTTLLLRIIPRFSFEAGEDEETEMIEDIEFDTEWLGLTVLALSLLTKESGLGIICTWSEKSTRFRLNVLLVGLSSGLAAASGA